MTAATRSCPGRDAPGTDAPGVDVPSADDPSDVADFLLRVSVGDRVAWEEVLRRYGKLVSATVRSFALQDADALDAVQMTWLRLAENAHRVQFPERLAGWLATTARHECLRILRQAANPTPNFPEAAPAALADPSIGPEQRVVDADTTATLWNIVAELPARQCALLRALFTDQPRPYAEVARATGIPLGGVGPTRARALRWLRGRLDGDGLGPETWR